MSKFNIQRPNNLQVSRAIDLYNRALENFRTAQIKSEQNLLLELFRSVLEFFATLNRPRLTKRARVISGTIPDPKKYNEFQEALVSDITASYDQQNALENVALSDYNLLQTERNRLDLDFKTMVNQAEDFTLFSRFPDRGEFLFRETFADTSRVDLIFPTENTQAFLNTDEGSSSLAIQTVDRAWNSISDFETIRILHDFPKSRGDSTTDTDIEFKDWYQGKMYGIWPSDPGDEDGFRVDTSEIDDIFQPTFNMIDVEDGPGTPSTFWEFEVVLLEGQRPSYDRNRDISAEDITFLPGRRPFVGVISTVIDDQSIEGFSGTNLEVRNPEGVFFRGNEEVDAWLWTQNPKLTKGFNFNLSIVLSLRTSKRLSNITITPHTFGKTTFPTITGISTKVDEDEGWVELPHAGHNFSGICSCESRLQTPDSVKIADSNGFDATSGLFAFTFPARNVKQIKIDFRQDKGYKIKYSVALFGKHWRIHTKKSGGWFHRDKHTYEWISKWVFIDIGGRDFMTAIAEIARLELPSDRIREALRVDTNILRRIGEEAVGVGVSALTGAAIGSVIPVIGTAIGAVIGAVIGLFKSIGQSIFGGKVTKEIDQIREDPAPVGDFDVSGTEGDGFYDIDTRHSNRHRYAIGVRDISSGAAIYSPRSEMVSINYFNPEPVHKIALDVNESIPKLFREIDPDATWIDYYISVDNGVTFFRINPINSPEVVFDDDLTVPKIITINSELSQERRKSFPFGDHGFIDSTIPIHSVRLKWVLKRPETDTSIEATSSISPSVHSPILRGYVLRILPRNSGRTKIL